MTTLLLDMLDDDAGASLVEYSLIIALVAGIAAVTLHKLGDGVSGPEYDLTTTFQNAALQAQAQ